MSDLLEGGRFAGLLLGGSGLILVLTVGTTAFVPAAIWTGSDEVALPLIARHRSVWLVANIGFAIGTVLTAAGLFALPTAVGARGVSAAGASAVAFALAGALWLVTLMVRLAVTPDVAARFVGSGTIDPSFASLGRLGTACYLAFIFLGGAATVGLGAAVLLGGALPAVVGWVSVVLGLVIVGGYLAFGDMLPIVVYLGPTIVGIALLLAP